MVKKVQAQMSTEIALDLVKASESVKSMTNLVNSATSAWKAQESQLRSAGDYLGATKAKYEGLGSAIQAQQAKIDSLKLKQSELKGNTQETANQYLNYQKQIDQASARLSSMETQQTKAKQAMDYYKSGLSELQKEYKQQNDLSKSYIERLEAEGKGNDALKAKVTASKNAIDNLNKQYEAQVKLLKQVARDGDGDAYVKAKQRINETATALARAKTQQDRLNDEWRKMNPTIWDKIKAKIHGVGSDIDDTADKSSRAKGIFSATFAANVISDAFQNTLGKIKGQFDELISSATEYTKYQQTMTASWNTLTGSAEEGAKMVKMTNDMAQAAANSTEMVDGMNQKFYSVTENTDKTAAMTKQILLLQDAFGQSDAAVENFATQWSQMIANGKVQGQDMMSIINVFPKMKQEIVKVTGEMTGNANITMEEFNKLQKDGEVTAEMAMKALENLSVKYKDSTENFAETLPGLERTINARVPAVISAFTSPFLEMKNPLLQRVGEWVSDKSTEERFTKLGETASKGLSTIMDGFAKVFKTGNSTEQLNKFMDKLEVWVTKTSEKIAANAPKIVDFFKETKKSLGSIFEIGKTFVGGAWDLIKDTFTGIAGAINKMSGNSKKAKDPMKNISSALGKVAKHKDAIELAGKAFVTYFAAKKVVRGVTSLYRGVTKLKNGFSAVTGVAPKVVTAFKTIGAAAAANPVGAVLVAVTALVAGFVLLYKHNKKFKKFVDDLAKNAKKAFDKIVKWFKNIPKNLSKTWDNIKDGAKGGMKKLGSAISDKLSDIGNKFKDTWNGIKDGFRDMWDGLKQLAGDGINAVIKIPNSGIDGINDLIHAFGGPKEAIKKIPKVKFAGGTGFFSGQRNAITRPTLATLNDGNDSPHTNNQEMVIMPNGKTILPQGRNAQMLLPAGAEVLTASETAWMMATMQNRQAFAKGTGFFTGIGKWANKTWNTVTDVTGNVWQGLKDGVEKFTQMFEFIKGAVTDPVGTLAKKFNPNADKLDGMFSNLGNALYKKPVEQAKEWWEELWGMAQSATDDGTVAIGAIGDDYRFKQFAKDSGADPWGYFYRECVSFVASRLANLGVNPSKFSNLGNGNQWVNANVPHLSRPRPGTVAVYTGGPVSSNHVDFVTAVRGDTYDGEEYNYMNNGQYHRYANRPISAAATFLDFGVRDIGASGDIELLSDKKSPLQKLIKSQVGGMFDWIKKAIAPIASPTEYFDDDSQSGSSGVERWRSSVVKALKANGIEPNDYRVSKILATIQRESNGNPNAQNNWDINAINGTPSIGLMQTIGPTFDAYKHAGHNNIRNGYDNLLAAINYIKHRYGTSDAAFNRVASYGYANGGLVSKHGIYQLAEGNMPEYVIPTDRAKRSRAWSLLAEVTSKFANEAPKTSDSTSDGAGILQKLETKLDTMITLLTQLVANGANPIELRNIIDGQSVSNGLAPYMQAAISNHERRQALLGGEIL